MFAARCPPGIAIPGESFNCSSNPVKSDESRSVDPSIYNPILDNSRKPIDPPVPLQYACTCIQISLDTLDTLSDPALVPGSAAFFHFAASQPPPFRLLCVLRSTTELGAIDLAVIEGVPTVAVVKNHETVVFKELTGVGMLSTLCCAREEPFSSNVSHRSHIMKTRPCSWTGGLAPRYMQHAHLAPPGPNPYPPQCQTRGNPKRRPSSGGNVHVPRSYHARHVRYSRFRRQ